MRFIVVTRDYSGLGFAVRLQDEGHDVILATSPSEEDQADPGRMQCFNLVGQGTYAFAPDKGVACDGVSGFYDTQFNLATSGMAFSRDSASLGVYDRTSTTGDGAVFGAFDGTTETALYLSSGGGLYCRINSGQDGAVAANTNSSR